MKLTIKTTPPGHDADNIYITNGKKKGFAFITKNKSAIGLVKCPECEQENYALSVMTGECAWCEYQITPDSINQTP